LNPEKKEQSKYIETRLMLYTFNCCTERNF